MHRLAKVFFEYLHIPVIHILCLSYETFCNLIDSVVRVDCRDYIDKISNTSENIKYMGVQKVEKRTV